MSFLTLEPEIFEPGLPLQGNVIPPPFDLNKQDIVSLIDLHFC